MHIGISAQPAAQVRQALHYTLRGDGGPRGDAGRSSVLEKKCWVIWVMIKV